MYITYIIYTSTYIFLYFSTCSHMVTKAGINMHTCVINHSRPETSTQHAWPFSAWLRRKQNATTSPRGALSSHQTPTLCNSIARISLISQNALEQISSTLFKHIKSQLCINSPFSAHLKCSRHWLDAYICVLVNHSFCYLTNCCILKKPGTVPAHNSWH